MRDFYPAIRLPSDAQRLVTIVLTVLMFTHHGYSGRRFGDVGDNVFYWDFVVLTWIPIYLLIYWVPRLG